MQRNFAEVDGFRKQRKVTHRGVFLAQTRGYFVASAGGPD